MKFYEKCENEILMVSEEVVEYQRIIKPQIPFSSVSANI